MNSMYYDNGVLKKGMSGGYIALMATIIISAILLVMAVEEGSLGWYSRFNILGTEAKEQASALAEGCADQALAAIITDPTYGAATTSVTTAGGTCSIFPVLFNMPASGYVTIKTQAEVRGSFANLEIAMNMSQIHLGTPQPGKGTLVVVTQVINDGGGLSVPSAFTMHVAATNPSQTAFGGEDTGVVVTMDAGAYTVTEDSLPGYSKTVSANCSGSISNGQVKFCTVTNDDITTTLTLIANVTNDNSGTNVPADFPLYLDGALVTLGQRVTVAAGTHTASTTLLAGYAMSPWGYDCTDDALITTPGHVDITDGQSKTCVISFDDLPPPTPACAETVMMLDRSGSMFTNSAWIPDEKTAAKSLIDLYSGVTPNPQISVGRFGDIATGVSAEIFQQLSTSYAAMKTAIDNGLPQNPLSYTNLADAVSKSSDELNSVRHVAGKEKVIILVSDGNPNRPSGATAMDTGFLSPAASAQDSGSSSWSNPAGAYATGGGDASGAVSGSAQRERYYTFGFGSGSGLPSGSTVNGIEAEADAWTTSTSFVTTPANSQAAPGSVTAPNQWTSPANAFASDNIYATDAVNGHQQGYGTFGFAIPANATITGVQVTAQAKITAAPTTLLSDNFGTGNTTTTVSPWSEGLGGSGGNGAELRAAGTGNDSASPDGGRFAVMLNDGFNDGWICRTVNAAGLSNLMLSYYWRGDSDANQSSDLGVVEYRTSGSCTNTSGWNTLQSHDLRNDTTWSTQAPFALPASLNNTTFLLRFRAATNANNEYFRVDAVTLTSTPAATGTLGVSLSSNGGAGYTAAKSASLSTTETVVTPAGNSATDLWGRLWIPSDFNDGNFVLRVQNNSASGITTSVDQVLVTVNYTTPVPTGTSCQLGMDLSWNGGATWTTEKTQTLTGAETTYTLGGASDDWSSSHTWAPAEFSNANFRARVRAIDPGSSCDNAATDHLDSLRLKVHYTQNADPVQAALNAADAAKLSGIDLFTIYFGSGNPTLLAQLASGSTANAPHQPGSYAQAGGLVSGDTGLAAPTAIAAPSQFTNATRAYASDNSYATDAVNGHQQGYGNFGFSVPPTATINGIAVEIEAKSSDTSGCQVGAEISANGGTSFTSTGNVAGLSGNDGTYTLGGSTNVWGSSWLPDDFTNGNFVVRLRNIDPGNACTNGSTLSVDRVRARVYYTVNNENNDGDNFFIAPTSADMHGIFDFIGEQVCPAILNLSSAPPPTTGTLMVITTVTNNNGGSLAESAFTANVNAINPSATSFAGSASGVSVTVDPGAYSISEDPVNGYNEILGATCSGSIVAGETRVCVLSNDDVPPPPPPPNFNVTTGSWQEVP